MKTFIALLRGINVGGHNMIPMSDLRVLCAKIGWSNVQTYIQSGNVVFSASGKPAALAMQLQRAIEGRFDLSIPVIVRAAADWSTYVKTNPFLDACKTESKLVMLCLAQNSPKADAPKNLRDGGVARSKLSPSLLDRSVGSPVTTRNWLTVLKLKELVNAPVAKMVK